MAADYEHSPQPQGMQLLAILLCAIWCGFAHIGLNCGITHDSHYSSNIQCDPEICMQMDMWPFGNITQHENLAFPLSCKQGSDWTCQQKTTHTKNSMNDDEMNYLDDGDEGLKCQSKHHLCRFPCGRCSFTKRAGSQTGMQYQLHSSVRRFLDYTQSRHVYAGILAIILCMSTFFEILILICAQERKRRPLRDTRNCSLQCRGFALFPGFRKCMVRLLSCAALLSALQGQAVSLQVLLPFFSREEGWNSNVPCTARDGQEQFAQHFGVSVSAWRLKRSSRIKHRHTIGDGNCMWRAAAAFTTQKWFTLKKKTITHMTQIANQHKNDSLKQHIQKLSRRNAWADEVALQGLCSYLQRDVVLAVGTHMICFHAPGAATDLGGPVALVLQKQHFSTLSRKDASKMIATCCRSIPETLDDYKMLSHGLTPKIHSRCVYADEYVRRDYVARHMRTIVHKIQHYPFQNCELNCPSCTLPFHRAVGVGAMPTYRPAGPGRPQRRPNESMADQFVRVAKAKAQPPHQPAPPFKAPPRRPSVAPFRTPPTPPKARPRSPPVPANAFAALPPPGARFAVPNTLCPTRGIQPKVPNAGCPSRGAQLEAPSSACPAGSAQLEVPNFARSDERPTPPRIRPPPKARQRDPAVTSSSLEPQSPVTGSVVPKTPPKSVLDSITVQILDEQEDLDQLRAMYMARSCVHALHEAPDCGAHAGTLHASHKQPTEAPKPSTQATAPAPARTTTRQRQHSATQGLQSVAACCLLSVWATLNWTALGSQPLIGGFCVCLPRCGVTPCNNLWWSPYCKGRDPDPEPSSVKAQTGCVLVGGGWLPIHKSTRVGMPDPTAHVRTHVARQENLFQQKQLLHTSKKRPKVRCSFVSNTSCAENTFSALSTSHDELSCGQQVCLITDLRSWLPWEFRRSRNPTVAAPDDTANVRPCSSPEALVPLKTCEQPSIPFSKVVEPCVPTALGDEVANLRGGMEHQGCLGQQPFQDISPISYHNEEVLNFGYLENSEISSFHSWIGAQRTPQDDYASDAIAPNSSVGQATTILDTPSPEVSSTKTWTQHSEGDCPRCLKRKRGQSFDISNDLCFEPHPDEHVEQQYLLAEAEFQSIQQFLDLQPIEYGSTECIASSHQSFLRNCSPFSPSVSVEPAPESSRHPDSIASSIYSFLRVNGPYPGWEYDEYPQDERGGHSSSSNAHHVPVQLPVYNSGDEDESSCANSLGELRDTWSEHSRRHDVLMYPPSSSFWNDRSIGSDGSLRPARSPDDFPLAGRFQSTTPDSQRIPTQPSSLDGGSDEDEHDMQMISKQQKRSKNLDFSFIQVLIFGGGDKNEGFAPNKADVSKMVQKLKMVEHGLQPKQIRMLLVSDNRLVQKIQRNSDAKQLQSCIEAAARRMGLTCGKPVAANQAVLQPARVVEANKGKGKQQGVRQNSHAAKATGKGKQTDDKPSNCDLASKGIGKGKGKGSPTPVKPKFTLCSYGWNVQPLEQFNPNVGAIYFCESEDEAKKIAEQAAGKLLPIAVLFPKPLEVGIGSPQSIIVEVNREQHGQAQVVSMQAWLHQLTSHEVLYRKTAPRIDIRRPETSKTAVLYATYSDEGASAQTKLEIQQKRIPAIKQWLLANLKHDPHLDIQDVWNQQYIKRDGDKHWYQVSIRVKHTDTDLFLALSAPGKVQFNGPASLKQEMCHLWLKKEGQPMQDGEVLSVLQKFKGKHLGAFWLRGTWAIRAKPDQMAVIRNELGRNEAPAYFLSNCSPEWDVADVSELLRQLAWDATVGPNDRRWKYGTCTWLVRSHNDPPIWGCPTNYGYERRMLRISSARKAKVTPTPERNRQTDPPVFQYNSWNAQWRPGRNHSTGQQASREKTYAEALSTTPWSLKRPKLEHAPSHQALSDDDDMDLDTPKNLLKQQIREMSEQNLIQQKQITDLTKQIQQLLEQVSALTAANSSVAAAAPPHEQQL